jgi:hypothetical protein
MPALASPSTWRSHPYVCRQHLFVLSPTVVFAARVNQEDFEYPLAEIAYDGVTVGAYTDIRPGMSVLFGTLPLTGDRGRGYIRKSPTDALLYIGWSSIGRRDGEFYGFDTLYITVLDDYRVWAKIPRIESDGTGFKEYELEVGDYGDAIPPVANGGAAVADFVDAGSETLVVNFDGSDSLSFTGATLTYLWSLPSSGAAITAGTITDAAITVEFEPGFYWMHLRVFDNVSGHYHTCHIPVLAAELDSSNLVENFEISSHRITPEGQMLEVTIYDELLEDNTPNDAGYPDGTLAMLFEEEWYNGTKGSLAGPSGREGLRFVGWHDTDTESVEGGERGIQKGLRFRCIDVAGRLKKLPGFPQSLEHDPTPESWIQQNEPNIDTFLHYLLQWHSTALDVADFQVSGLGENYPFTTLQSGGQSLYEQVDQRARAIVHRLSCDTKGRLWVREDPLLVDAGDRTAVEVVALEESDWTRLEVERTRHPRYHWLRGSAIVASSEAVSAVFCVAPGKAPSQGERVFSAGQQLVADQDELNAREGHRYARLNADWSAFRLALAHSGDAGFEPALMEWVTLAVGVDAAAGRGFTWSSGTDRFLPLEVAIAYRHTANGTLKQVELVLEKETSGPPAATEVQSVQAQNVTRPARRPAAYFPVNTRAALGTIPIGNSAGMYAYCNTHILRTRPPYTAPTTWEILLTVATDLLAGQTLLRFKLDPWDPKNRAYVLTTDFSTAAKAWELTGLDGTAGTQTVTLLETSSADFNNPSGGMDLQGSINVEGGLWFTVREVNGAGPAGWRAHTYRRLGYAASWEDVITWNSGATGDEQGNFVMGYHSVYPAGKLYRLAGNNDAIPDSNLRIFRSENLGGTWAEETITNAVLPLGVSIKVPYNNNPNDEVVYLAVRATGLGVETLWRRSEAGLWSAIGGAPQGDGTYYPIGPSSGRSAEEAVDSLDIHTFNQSLVRYTAPDANLLCVSEDGGVTWQTKAMPGPMHFLGSWPDDEDILFISGGAEASENRKVFFSEDGGDTWIDLSGNLSSLITNIFIRGVVPVWVS